jgi:acyl-homoserine lactone acylase PvdQ
VQQSEGLLTLVVGARTAMGRWRVILGGLAALCLLAFAPASAMAELEPVDDSGAAFQILAPGESGEVPILSSNPFATDQDILYSKLTARGGHVTKGALEKFYLSEKFEKPATSGPCNAPTVVASCTEEPRPGALIRRDSHMVPHIEGETRSDAMFASGWVAAKDRGLLLKFGLGPAYVAALSVPGLNAFELLLTLRTFKPSKQAEEFVGNQVQSLKEKGPRGEQVIEDLEAWAEGANAVKDLPHINLAQAIAGFAFIGSIFGNGGGGEVTNSNFLARLEAKFGETEGLKIFHDLRESNDPEAPTTTSTEFPYDTEPTGKPPAGAAVIEPGSLSPAEIKANQAAQASHRKASNFLLVGAENTEAKHPVAVMGPQLGYYYPEIVYQEDLHAPGLDAQGIVAPISPYVFIGRGRDFAWSLTSAGSENEQNFLLKLCTPEEEEPVTRETEYYEHDGECIKMTVLDAGKIGKKEGPKGEELEPEHEVFIKESIYGPVTGTVMVEGKPYAVARDRSTRGSEPAGELAFSDFDSNRVHTPQQFFEAANELQTTFNMAYIDSKNIAYFSTGKLPKLAPETDPALPTFGTGPYDWKGFLSLEEHPHVVQPANEQLLNWNNKPAPGWGAASNEWSYGPLHRVQMYKGFTNKMTEARDASIMNHAATEDFRATMVWPTIEKVLAASSAPSPLATSAEKVLKGWIEKGASRYGKEHPKAAGAAVIDSVFQPVEEAVLSPVLGELLGEFKGIAGPDDHPSSHGSSFGGGWYGYVYKDLRSLLGEPVAEPYSRPYCGNGNLKACSESLWAAMQKALETTATEQKTSNPKKWKAAKVVLEFPPGGNESQEIPWTNRSTFQQVIEFTSHQEEDLVGPLE